MNLIQTSHGVAIERADGSLTLIRLIIGIGRNYAEHAKEQGAELPSRPMVFTKHPGSVCVSGVAIRVPKVCQDRPQVDFEAELGVIVGVGSRGEACRDVPVERALDYVLGYTCGNDVSARWWQKEGSGGQFTRGKSFDTFCPLGPRVVEASAIREAQNLDVICRVNGREMQHGNTKDMIFSVARLVSDLSQGATLWPGTLIMTGTPSGVGMARNPPEYLKDGDIVEVEIPGIGVLKNPVVFE